MFDATFWNSFSFMVVKAWETLVNTFVKILNAFGVKSTAVCNGIIYSVQLYNIYLFMFVEYKSSEINQKKKLNDQGVICCITDDKKLKLHVHKFHNILCVLVFWIKLIRNVFFFYERMVELI